jgi:hypothetical protein
MPWNRRAALTAEMTMTLLRAKGRIAAALF